MKILGLLLALVAFVFVLTTLRLGDNPATHRMAAIAVLMSILWISEAIPLAATALLPLVLFPALGISSTKAVSTHYMNSTVFLLIGGFMIALAMQRWGLHKRIALNVLALFGSRPKRLLGGFCIATAILSMWISNTATTLVMLPIALAILARFSDEIDPYEAQRFATGLLLAIAYSASIGGMLTLIGTAPNLVFVQIYETSLATGDSIGFAQWMLLSLPIGLTMLLVVTIGISYLYFRGIPEHNALGTVVQDEKRALGSISSAEISVLLVFMITAALWISRKNIEIGDFALLGWQNRFDPKHLFDDGTIAVAMAILLFLIPAKQSDGTATTILNNSVFQELPWSVVVLFGGGFALASGFVDSGLSNYLASRLQGITSIGLLPTIAAVAATMTFMTELTSNTATTQLVLPILVSATKLADLSPLWLMLPATFSASCAFMFPVATPPNAIIFGSGRIRVIDMVKTGLVLNIVGTIVISLSVWLLAPYIFDL